jgi:hypothetical protein
MTQAQMTNQAPFKIGSTGLCNRTRTNPNPNPNSMAIRLLSLINSILLASLSRKSPGLAGLLLV